MKSLSLIIQKIWPMLKFLQTNRRTGQKLYAPDLSIRGHKKTKNKNKKGKKKKEIHSLIKSTKVSGRSPKFVCETIDI
jgi:hypothetical protein